MKLQTSLGEYLSRNFSNAPVSEKYYLLLVQESVTTPGRSGLLSFDDARPRVILALLRICMAGTFTFEATYLSLRRTFTGIGETKKKRVAHSFSF